MTFIGLLILATRIQQDLIGSMRSVLLPEEVGVGNPVSSPGTLRWARVVEVTHATPAVKFFELHITGETPMGFHVYRADRIPTLYPEGALVSDCPLI